MLQDVVPNKRISPCLSTGNPKTGQANLAVCYLDRAAFNQGENAQYQIGIDENGKAFTLTAKGPGAVCCPICNNGDVAGTLDANYGKGTGMRSGVEREIIAQFARKKWVVRRVIPKECARLQGMPDWWCDDIPHKDAPEYKMWGNGMALPCAMFILQGISKQLQKQILHSLEVS